MPTRGRTSRASLRNFKILFNNYIQYMGNNLPTRKSPRASFYDYSDGDFFVTICTLEKEHSFGEIKDGIMNYSSVGIYCDQQLKDIPQHYPYAQALIQQVMPNHLHVIIRLEPEGDYKIPQIRTLLSVVVGGIKRAVTMFARRNGHQFGWQTRYHDHKIRNLIDGQRIWEYIEGNVQKWQEDCFNLYDRNPDPFGIKGQK